MPHGDGKAEHTKPSVASPCQRLCGLDAEKLCRTCGRTLEEIRNWPEMSDEEKLSVLARLQNN